MTRVVCLMVQHNGAINPSDCTKSRDTRRTSVKNIPVDGPSDFGKVLTFRRDGLVISKINLERGDRGSGARLNYITFSGVDPFFSPFSLLRGLEGLE
jgi:hypothetical protein